MRRLSQRCTLDFYTQAVWPGQTRGAGRFALPVRSAPRVGMRLRDHRDGVTTLAALRGQLRRSKCGLLHFRTFSETTRKFLV